MNAPNAPARLGFLAGSAEARTSDLNLLLRSPDVRMIVTATGGTGAPPPPRGLPGPSCGSRVLRQAEQPFSPHGRDDGEDKRPHLSRAKRGRVRRARPLTDFTKRNLWPLLRNDLLLSHASPVSWGMQVVRPDPPVEGPLSGGDLRGVQLLIGTPWTPDWSGPILFVELYGVELFRLDGLLAHLRLAGVLRELRNLITGRPVECDAVEVETLDDVVLRSCRGYAIPVVTDVLIGHTDDKITVPLGCRVRLETGRCSLELLEAPTA